jgi:hypothetical protein
MLLDCRIGKHKLLGRLSLLDSVGNIWARVVLKHSANIQPLHKTEKDCHD